MTKFEKKLDIGYAFSYKKKQQQLTRRNAGQQRVHEAFCTLTQV